MKEVFHRTNLAQKIGNGILSSNPLSSVSSGLFLAAPRRTGKSTFIREDLIPFLKRKDVVVIYCDLWEDKGVSPERVILNAVREEINKNKSAIVKILNKINISEINTQVAKIKLNHIGEGKDISLVSALSTLSEVTQKKIIFIIDEAQQTLNNKKSSNIMFALKAARDELNSSPYKGFRLIATGSNRDKLSVLRNNKKQAFFGSPLIDFPVLGNGYIKWFCKNLKEFGYVSEKKALELFTESDYQPEVFGQALDHILFNVSINQNNFEETFIKEVHELINDKINQNIKIINSLTPIQTAIINVIVDEVDNFVPFHSNTLEKYQEYINKNVVKNGLVNKDKSHTITLANVQKSIKILESEGLIWKSGRGAYILEDKNIYRALIKMKNSNKSGLNNFNKTKPFR